MSVLLIVCACVTFVALLGMLGIALLNLTTFPRLRDFACSEPNPASVRSVSVLVPARNEAARISQSVQSLLAQHCVDFELIVLDDNSCDGTCEVATRAGAGDPRFSCVRGAPLPAGWVGKSWACHQLAAMARHDLLLFTDADVTWNDGALAAVVNAYEAKQPGLLTVWPTQRTVSWCERLAVPLMAFAILAYLPEQLVHATPYPAAAAANGQCMVFDRNNYSAVGGHRSVKNTVLEDVVLARSMKRSGKSVWMFDAGGLLLCRMYCGCSEVYYGYAKNILSGHGMSIAALVASAGFHTVVFVLPFIWFIAGVFVPVLGWPFVPLVLYLLGVGVRAITAYISRQRLADSLLMPLSSAFMASIAAYAIYLQVRYGGPLWKGRRVRMARANRHD